MTVWIVIIINDLFHVNSSKVISYQGIKELRGAGRERVRDKILENSGGVNQEEIFSLYISEISCLFDL